MKYLLSTVLAWFMAIMAAWSASTTVTQVSASISVTTATDYHITSATPFTSSGNVNLKHADAVLILDEVRPYQARTTWLSHVKINGANASEGSNCQLKIYNRGCIIVPHGSGFQPLTVYSGTSQTGTSYSNYSVGTSHNLTSATMNNNIRSFTLKRGYMVCMSNKPNGRGVNRLYIAANADRTMDLPKELAGRVSWIKITQWNDASKKGYAGNAQDANDALQTTWCYNWDASSWGYSNQEYVTQRKQRWWPGISECGNNCATSILGHNEPDNTLDDNEDNCDVNVVLNYWEELMATGKRLGSPAVSSNYAWLTEFLDSIDARGWRCDFVALHCYWYNDWSSWNSTIAGYHNKYNRPLWITEMNYGANWTGWPGSDRSASSENYQIEYNHMKPILDGLKQMGYMERVAPYNWVEDCRKFYNTNDASLASNGYLTPIGTYYRDMDMGLAFNPNYEHQPSAPKYSRNKVKDLTMSYTYSTQTGTLTWTDDNGDLTESITVQRSTNGTSWSNIGTVSVDETLDSYAFDTQITSSGTYYYRLRLIGYDNAAYYSNVISREIVTGVTENSINANMTSIIANAECTNTSGWEIWSASGEKWHTQGASYTNGTASMQNFIERWCNSGDPSTLSDSYMRQTINGIPNGIYRLEADVIACQQSSSYTYSGSPTGVYLFATGDKTNRTACATDNGKPQHFTVDAVVTGNQLTIGVETDGATCNWAGVDNFKLTYLKGGTSGFKSRLEELINTTTGYETTYSSFAAELKDEADAAQAVVDDATATIEKFSAAICRLENMCALVSGETDANLFAKGNQWNGSIPANADNANYRYGCYEFYQKAFNANKTLNNLPTGVYKISVKGFQRPGAYGNVTSESKVDAALYADEQTMKLKNIVAGGLSSASISGAVRSGAGNYVPNTMWQAEQYFQQGLYNNVLSVFVEDGTVCVGISNTNASSNYWTIYDDLAITYMGYSASVLNALYEEKAMIASSLESRPMCKDSLLAMRQADAEVQQAISQNADGKLILSMLSAFGETITAAEHSADTYSELGERLDWAEEQKTLYPRSHGADAFEGLTTIAADYQAGNYADEEIAQAVVSVKTMVNTYLMADAVIDASESNPIDVSFVIENPSFSDNSNHWQVSGTGSAYAGAVDYECFEVFNQPFSLAQHLYGMPSGLYVLEVQAFYRNGGQAEHKAAIESGTAVSNAQLFIENADGEKTFAPIAFISDCFVSDISSANVGDTWYQYDSGKYVADRMVSAAYVFDTAQLYQPTESSNTVSMTFTAANGATLGIGAYKSALSANDWTILAGFRLIYKGNPEPAVPTGIKCLDSTSLFPADVFSANGQLIRRQASSLDALPHGIYLVNGKKLMK